MLFNSFVFLFLFLPLTLTLYHGLNFCRCYTLAKAALVLASLCFYAWFNPSYLPIILSSITVNYIAGKAITSSKSHVWRKLWLTLAVASSRHPASTSRTSLSVACRQCANEV